MFPREGFPNKLPRVRQILLLTNLQGNRIYQPAEEEGPHYIIDNLFRFGRKGKHIDTAKNEVSGEIEKPAANFKVGYSNRKQMGGYSWVPLFSNFASLSRILKGKQIMPANRLTTRIKSVFSWYDETGEYYFRN